MTSGEITAPKPFVFVLMPFETAFDDIYKFGIKGAADDVGAYAERVDEQIFSEGILDRIFNQISKADVVVADMTGRNPNVFYEVGYAHALGKAVVLLTQKTDDIPFDLKHRQHTVYGGKIETLRDELRPKLQWALAEAQRRQLGVALERFSVRINGNAVAVGISPETPAAIAGTVKQETFRLPVHLRNDSVEALLGITHIYLFAAPGSSVVPYEVVSDYSNLFSTQMTLGSAAPASTTKTVELQAFVANLVDAADGLTNQYRLRTTFPAMPPGAIEEVNISMKFRTGETKCDGLFRLRLHSQRQFHDYTFRLFVGVGTEKPAVADKSPAEASPANALASIASKAPELGTAKKKRAKRNKSPK